MTAKAKKDRLETILHALEKAATGDYSQRLDFASREDDLGLIADAVNKFLKKTEKKFSASRQTTADLTDDARRYHHILDTIEESYFEVDLGGNIFFFNDTMVRDLGYSHDELRGINYRKFVDEDNAQKIYEAFHQVFLTGMPIKGFDWEILKKNGDKVNVESSVSLMCDEAGKPIGFRGIVRDVSLRVKTQSDLQENEEKYRTILDIMEEGYIESSLRGRVTFVSDAACRLMGYTSEQLIGMHYKEYLTPDVARKMEEMFQRVYRTGEPERLLDYDLLRKDGSIITYEISAAIKHDASGRPSGFRILTRDVSWRKRAEHEKRVSEEKYRTILEIMGEGYFEADIHGIVTFVNDAGCALVGYEREDLIGTLYDHYATEESLSTIKDVYRKIFKNELATATLDYEVITKNGSIRVHQQSVALIRNETGRPGGFRVLVRDITERRKAEDALRSSEEKYRHILENMEETYLETDLRGNFLFFNDSLCHTLGYSREELEKANYRRIIPSNTIQSTFEALNEIYRTGLKKTLFEHALLTKPGTIIYAEVSISLMRSGLGEPIGFSAIGRDVTQRLQNERIIQDREKRLRMITDNISDIIWTMDFNLRWTYLSPSTLKITGFSPEEVLGIPLKAMLPGETYALVEQRLADALANERAGNATNGRNAATFEIPILHRNGTELWVEVSANFNRDEKGEPVEIVGVTRVITERKKVQKALEESEAIYRKTLESTSDGVAIVQNGRYVYFNEQLLRTLGLPKEYRAGGEPLGALVHTDDARVIRESYSKHLRGEPSPNKFDIRVNRPDGKLLYLLVTSADTVYKGKPAVLSFVQDITERKNAENALKESEKRYRTMTENVNDIVWVVDLDLRITYVSQSNMRLTGFAPEEIQNKPLDVFIAPDSLALASRLLSEELAQEASGRPVDPKRSRSLQIEVYSKLGDNVWLEVSATFNRDANGKATEILAVGRNITQRRNMEKALAESEQRFRMIIENMKEVVWTTDLNLRFTYMSPSCFLLTGYTPDELMALPLDKLLMPESLKLATNKVMEELALENDTEAADPNRSRTVEQEILCKNGDRAWIEVTATFMRNGEGKATGMLMAGRDITASKKARAEKDRLEAQLMQAQKMEIVGRLAGGVAHDFNNMLSVILGYVDLAKLRLGRLHPVLKDIAEIEKAAVRSRDITTQLLAFSRKQIIEPKIIDLNDLVAHTQKALIRLIGEDIGLQVVMGENLWPIKFDPSQIEQILINLAVNARDAMPDGGQLIIETVNTVLDDSYCEKNIDCIPGHYVRLSFGDNGVGMDKETLQHIFEPFFTTKDVGKGTGLGLATVYGIVKQNNGYVNVFSEPARGTTFSIFLPRAEGENDILIESEEEEKITGTGNILLVEDDAMVLQITRGILESLGYTVTSVEKPMDAVEYCRDPDACIDLVISDVVMPGISGKELRNKVMEIRPDINMIFMSGYTADVIAHHGVLEEGVQFIQKPFTIKSLAAKVTEALAAKNNI